jgi:hypothetical protein
MCTAGDGKRTQNMCFEGSWGGLILRTVQPVKVAKHASEYSGSNSTEYSQGENGNGYAPRNIGAEMKRAADQMRNEQENPMEAYDQKLNDFGIEMQGSSIDVVGYKPPIDQV